MALVANKYQRLLLKISGETLGGAEGNGLNEEAIRDICQKIEEVYRLNYQIALVGGGGNIFRGNQSGLKDRTVADTIGMMATIINALTLEQYLANIGISSQVFTSMPVKSAQLFDHRKAIDCLDNNRIAIFGGGTGLPYFSTDTTSALRALEVNAQVILKATKVDGIYDSDPVKNKKAKRFATISYNEVLEKNLRVMDLTSISLCKDNKLPIIIFDINRPHSIKRVLEDKDQGSVICE